MKNRLVKSAYFYHLATAKVSGSYWCPETFGLQKDVNDTSIAKERHDPEEEEHDTEEVRDQRVHWSKLAPMRAHYFHHLKLTK